jgi:hypothetical protein
VASAGHDPAGAQRTATTPTPAGGCPGGFAATADAPYSLLPSRKLHPNSGPGARINYVEQQKNITNHRRMGKRVSSIQAQAANDSVLADCGSGHR